MNFNWIKTMSQTVFGLLVMLIMVSCGNSKEEVGSESMISGATNKTWKADKELDASGEKDKLTREENDQAMQFYSDGRFALGGGGTLQTGTWSFDKSANRLTLNFENQEMAENFEVTKLTDDEMNLKAADGSEMRLKAE
jgi:hypothetical protein